MVPSTKLRVRCRALLLNDAGKVFMQNRHRIGATSHWMPFFITARCSGGMVEADSPGIKDAILPVAIARAIWRETVGFMLHEEHVYTNTC